MRRDTLRIREIHWNNCAQQIIKKTADRSTRRFNLQAYRNTFSAVAKALNVVRTRYCKDIPKKHAKRANSAFKAADIALCLSLLFFFIYLLLFAFSIQPNDSEQISNTIIAQYSKIASAVNTFLGSESGFHSFTINKILLVAASTFLAGSLLLEGIVMFLVLVFGPKLAISSSIGGGIASIAMKLTIPPFLVLSPILDFLYNYIFAPFHENWAKIPERHQHWVTVGTAAAIGSGWTLIAMTNRYDFRKLVLITLGFAALWILVKVTISASKALGDIFHYVACSTTDGGPAVRTQIQAHCNEFVWKARDNSGWRSAELIFIGHSLGSVILLDYLWNGNLPKNRKITLITMGSPLHRFFFRFFPDLYFPRGGRCISIPTL